METPLVDLVFYVCALFGVGLWTILRLGLAGLRGRGIPSVPDRFGRGARGRTIGALLILIGSAFIFLSLAGAFRLVERLSS